MTRETEKQVQQSRRESRQDKNYQSMRFFEQAAKAQDDSNRAYGFKISAKVGR